MLNSGFVYIGTLIGSVGAVVYFLDAVKGKIQPHRVSFLLWSLAPFIIFAAQIKQGLGIETVMTFSQGFLPFLIFLATFINKKAEWKITTFDLTCGLLSLIGLVLWLITKVGNVAIFFSIIADGLAAVPTIVKAYKFPDTELAWPWVTTAFGVLLTVLTLKQLNFANSAFFIYVILVNSLVFVLVQFRVGEKVFKK